MTGEQKNTIALFLDAAGASLGSSYVFDAPVYNFEDDTQVPQNHADEKAASVAVPHDERESVKNKLLSVAEDIRACTKCRLCAGRKNAVPGEGVPHPLVMVIGEGPGADEDASGRPFVGRAGQLLDKMLLSIDLSRGKNCFIANVVKCRPPQNRDPEPDETASCADFLAEQMRLLKPLAILSVGRVPTKTLLQTETGITQLRGKWKEYNGIPFLPTFHPSYLLRDESQKAPAWEDLKMLCRKIAELDSVYAVQTEELRKMRKI